MWRGKEEKQKANKCPHLCSFPNFLFTTSGKATKWKGTPVAAIVPVVTQGRWEGGSKNQRGKGRDDLSTSLLETDTCSIFPGVHGLVSAQVMPPGKSEDRVPVLPVMLAERLSRSSSTSPRPHSSLGIEEGPLQPPDRASI